MVSFFRTIPGRASTAIAQKTSQKVPNQGTEPKYRECQRQRN